MQNEGKVIAELVKMAEMYDPKDVKTKIGKMETLQCKGIMMMIASRPFKQAS